MKIGIVGSSKADFNKAKILIMDIIVNYPDDTEFVSGGAKGVDAAVEEACYILSKSITIFRPSGQNWNGFKQRNLRIANYCDKVISIALPFKEGHHCWHCDSAKHSKTGGCYTMKFAKEGEVMILD